MEKGKHPVYQYWPWMLAAATVLLAAWAVCETLAIFATGGYTRELAGRALGRLGWGAALWVVLAMVGRRFRPAQLRIPPRRPDVQRPVRRSLEEAVRIIKRDTRHFAKRQITWFKREKDVIWLDKRQFSDRDGLLEEMLGYLRKKGIQ